MILRNRIRDRLQQHSFTGTWRRNYEGALALARSPKPVEMKLGQEFLSSGQTLLASFQDLKKVEPRQKRHDRLVHDNGEPEPERDVEAELQAEREKIAKGAQRPDLNNGQQLFTQARGNCVETVRKQPNIIARCDEIQIQFTGSHRPCAFGHPLETSRASLPGSRRW